MYEKTHGFANSATTVITKIPVRIAVSSIYDGDGTALVDDRKKEQMVSQIPRNSAVEYGKRGVTEKLLGCPLSDRESQSIFVDRSCTAFFRTKADTLLTITYRNYCSAGRFWNCRATQLYCLVALCRYCATIFRPSILRSSISICPE